VITAAMPPEERPEVTASDSWTGGTSDWRRKTRFDRWADAHPWKAGGIGLAIASGGSALQLHDAPLSVLALVFVGQAVLMMAIVGSMYAGVWLFSKLVVKVDAGNVLSLAPSQRNYLIVVLVVGIVLSQLAGPVLIIRIARLLMEHL
jgi:hypothetical protein